MNIGRKIFFFFQMMLLTGCLLYLVARPMLSPFYTVFLDGYGEIKWMALGYGARGDAMAASWTEEGDLRLQAFRLDKTRGKRWVARIPEEYREGTISDLCPIRGDLAMLGIYSLKGDSLAVFRLQAGAEPECLMQESCEGTVSSERIQNMRMSSFYQENGKVYFGFYGKGELRAYACPETSGAAEALGSERRETDSILSAMVLSDGSWVLGGCRDGVGYLNMGGSGGLVEGIGRVEALCRGRVGWYFLDGDTLEVRFVDPGTGKLQSLFPMEAYFTYTVTDLVLTDGERVMTLIDRDALVFAGADGYEEVFGVLAPPLRVSVVVLLGFAFICALGGAILTYAICLSRGGYISMAVYNGSILIVLTLLSSIVVKEKVLLPLSEELLRTANEKFIQGSIVCNLEDRVVPDQELLYRVCRQLEFGENGYRNALAIYAEKVDGKWYLLNGARGPTSPAFLSLVADQALETGEPSSWQRGGMVLYGEPRGEGVIMVLVDGASSTVDVSDDWVRDAAAYCIAPITLAGIVIFVLLVRRMRQLTRQMELITEGKATGENRLVLRSGDEFESMASSINSLAEWLEREKQRQAEVENAYRRFVPEKVLALLGGKSILDTNKDTFSVRRMTVMRVGFGYPAGFYSNPENSHVLFQSINQIIERTASVASQNGGTVFNFAFDSYDVIMDLDSARAVSTAVTMQEQTLSFNSNRIAEGLPPVQLSIAIDVGDVVLGIVGDDSRLQPVGISTTFSVVEELFALCKRLDAKILCTEMIVSDAEKYGNRYVGKCTVGALPIRVYEVFEGDDYALRRAKAGYAAEFSRAVLELYSGQTTLAKKEFLHLAHSVPEDGSARYYLYLSDRMERNPDLECSLSVPIGNGERR